MTSRLVQGCRLILLALSGSPALALENLALRQQLAIYQRTTPHPRLRRSDRLFWIGLSRLWREWRSALIVVRPETVLSWHRRGFRLYWSLRSARRGGRPAVSAELTTLIARMGDANPLWGAPRIHGELLKLGLTVSERTVSRLMQRRGRPPSQTWRTFLRNHVADLVAVDFFTVPTATFRIVFVFVVLAHDRRRVVHFNVTDHPTARWTAQQIVEAFADDTGPSYLLRDRDTVYNAYFRTRVTSLGLREVLTAPRSPWQNAFAERVIGSVRRECLDHILVFGERHLRRLLKQYFAYYHRSRTHLPLAKDTPEHRPVQRRERGPVIAVPEVSGLHHRYERRVA